MKSLMNSTWYLNLLFFLLISAGFLKPSSIKNGNEVPYNKYADCVFECAFKPGNLQYEQKTQYTKIEGKNFISVQFKPDSTYHIRLEVLEKNDTLLVWKNFEFSGKYEIFEMSQISLLGKHPFESNRIKIIEKRKKNEILILGFIFKFNDYFARYNDKKQSTYCDGTCVFSEQE